MNMFPDLNVAGFLLFMEARQDWRGMGDSILIDNSLYYSQEYKIEIGNPGDDLFYFFDYDERYYSINMEFQHFHSFYEMYILLDDQAGHIIDGTWYDLRCGDIVCLRPSLLHKTYYPEGKPCKRLIIQFAIPPGHSKLDSCMNTIYHVFEGGCPIYRFDENTRKSVFEKLNAIYRVSQTGDELMPLRVHSRFLEFLAVLYNNRNHNLYTNNADFDNVTEKIYQITTYIHSHITETLSLESLSRDFFISSFYLSHQFKRVTGFNLTQYIQMTRIRNAQNLLASTDMTISDIAFSCGFTSFSQFNRAFNKFVGAAPTVYRKQARAGAVPTMSIDNT